MPLLSRGSPIRYGSSGRSLSDEPRRLTLLDAPAGWGKTTLLAEWAADPRERRPFAWFNVDGTDNDQASAHARGLPPARPPRRPRRHDVPRRASAAQCAARDRDTHGRPTAS